MSLKGRRSTSFATPTPHEPARERRFAFADLIAELRRRRVVRFALGYCAVAFVLLQLGRDRPSGVRHGRHRVRILVVLVVLGFPPGVALAWVYELTRDGIRRTPDSPAQGMLPRVAFFVLTIGIAGGLAGWLSSRGAFTPGGEQETIALEAYDPSQPITSIAVLPLEDFSPDASEAYFVAGLQEELTASLGQLEWLRVASRTSVRQYQGTTTSAPVIGRELGVDALVEGSVTRAGDQVRITLQLIHAASDSHIETFRFDREMTDVLALQSEVARAVTSGIPGRPGQQGEVALVAASGPSGDPAAQEAYLRGRYEYGLGTADGYRRAVEYFQEALRGDSDSLPRSRVWPERASWPPSKTASWMPGRWGGQARKPPAPWRSIRVPPKHGRWSTSSNGASPGSRPRKDSRFRPQLGSEPVPPGFHSPSWIPPGPWPRRRSAAAWRTP